MEDILKSGIYDEEIQNHFHKKGGKKQRPKNPFFKEETVENVINEEEVVNSDSTIDEDDPQPHSEEFQKLYDQLDKNVTDADYVGDNFEQIYENLIVGEEHVTGSGSFLPPEILAHHTDSHHQRIGLLTKYVETSNYSLTEADDAVNQNWKNEGET